MALLPRYPSQPLPQLQQPTYGGIQAGSDASLGGIGGRGSVPMPGALLAPSLAALTGQGGIGTDSQSDRAYAQTVAGESRANSEYATRMKAQQEAQIAAEARARVPLISPYDQKRFDLAAQTQKYNETQAAASQRDAAAGKQRQMAQAAEQTAQQEQRAAEQRAQQQRAADLAARQQANDANQQKMLALTSQFTAAQGGGAAASAIPPPVSRNSGANAAMEQAARAAAFSRAKDQAGALTRASLNSLAGEMSGRGVSGSGEEAVRTAGAVGSGAGYLGDITREQMLADLGSATHNADLGYQGDITQRGQTISAQDAAAARRQQQQQSILSLLGQSGSIY